MSDLALIYLQRNTTINTLLEVPFWSLCEVWILLWDQCGNVRLIYCSDEQNQPLTFQGYLTTIVWSALFHNLQQPHGINSQFTFLHKNMANFQSYCMFRFYNMFQQNKICNIK